MGVNQLYQALKPFCEKINSVIENGNQISIISHLDADGIASASIISTSLARLGANCSVRTVSDMTLNVIEQMRYENHDFYIITDLGAGMANELLNALDRKNKDLSSIAIVSAVGDRQDQGDKKSLIGLNLEIVKIAQSLGLISI